MGVSRRADAAHAIRTGARGEALLAPAITRRLIEDFCERSRPTAATPDALSQLSDRELEVVRLVARGLSNAEIAKQLYLDETTIKSHVARILAKPDRRDRVKTVVFTYETG